MTDLKFTKMHGLGNDFIIVDGRNDALTGYDLGELSRELCDRHFGIGADGLLVIETSDHSDYRMRVFNPDGSEPEMCGNGIRCFAKYLYETESEKKELFSVETKGGVILPGIVASSDNVTAVEVDMGAPRFKSTEIPTTLTGTTPPAGSSSAPPDAVINEPLKVGAETYAVTCVSMGNPHAVIFVGDLEAVNLDVVGPAIETHPAFPKKTNVEFVQVESPTEMRLAVWERGAGETLACGTGACAALVAGVLTGKTQRQAFVHLPGGPLQIEWSKENDHVIMTGPAVTGFEGTYKLGS